MSVIHLKFVKVKVNVKVIEKIYSITVIYSKISIQPQFVAYKNATYLRSVTPCSFSCVKDNAKAVTAKCAQKISVKFQKTYCKRFGFLFSKVAGENSQDF